MVVDFPLKRQKVFRNQART